MIGCLRCRTGVKFDRILPAGFRILGALEDIARARGIELWLTSGTDSHALGRHPLGEAYDVAITGLTPTVLESILKGLRADLGPLFTVLYESPVMPSDPILAALVFVNPDATGPHLHCQPKRGTIYPTS